MPWGNLCWTEKREWVLSTEFSFVPANSHHCKVLSLFFFSVFILKSIGAFSDRQMADSAGFKLHFIQDQDQDSLLVSCLTHSLLFHFVKRKKKSFGIKTQFHSQSYIVSFTIIKLYFSWVIFWIIEQFFLYQIWAEIAIVRFWHGPNSPEKKKKDNTLVISLALML